MKPQANQSVLVRHKSVPTKQGVVSAISKHTEVLPIVNVYEDGTISTPSGDLFNVIPSNDSRSHWITVS